LATADDVGRRDLIALAAAAQYAIIPTWLGLSLVLGFPDPATTLTRLATFGLNVVTILAIGAVTYVLLDMRGDDVRRFARETEGREAGERLASRRP
ncbi:MAG: hypothetical protein IRY97_08340, partial [Thermomicrobiaceae bacterium]|nr:hypothetical protein [Thermomicrobiaceae bacterium]